MARKPPIRIMERDKSEYRRLVRNANRKRRRTFKKYGVDLSDEITLPSLESFSTRDEFNLKKEEIKSFTNRSNLKYQFVKNKHEVVASKREIREATQTTKQAQAQADRQMKEIADKPVTRRGKPYSTVGEQARHFTQPDTTGIYRPQDFEFEDVRSRDRLEQIQSRNEKRLDPNYYSEREDRMKDNFIKKLEGSFNSDADDIVEKIEKMPSTDFYDMWLQIEEIDFDQYDSDGEHVTATEGDLEQIRTHLDEYFDGGKDNDLQSF